MQRTPKTPPRFQRTSASRIFQLLRHVSRSFYLTLRVLPNSVRPQIGLAYLLARTTDTIADTTIVPVEHRLETLEGLSKSILNAAGAKFHLDSTVWHKDSSPERLLLDHIEEALAALDRLNSNDQLLIRSVIATITSGQILDLERFQFATSKRIHALQSLTELDDYTYRVAGCVGEFWNQMCSAHIYQQEAWNEQEWRSLSIRFGKGLQLVNILRDLKEDLSQGRCYVPEQELHKLGMTAADLLDPKKLDRFAPLHAKLLSLAEEHLTAGWQYTVSLPKGHPRMKLACAWPLLIGIKTLRRLKLVGALQADHRIKVTRPEIRQILLKSIVLLPIKTKWDRLFYSQ
jgi:farnesyl-diphosphate farnesyltransferase